MEPVFELTIISSLTLKIDMPPVWIRKQHLFFSTKEAAIREAEFHAVTMAEMSLEWCKRWPGYHSTQYANAWKPGTGKIGYYYQIRSNQSNEAELDARYVANGGRYLSKWS